MPCGAAAPPADIFALCEPKWQLAPANGVAGPQSIHFIFAIAVISMSEIRTCRLTPRVQTLINNLANDVASNVGQSVGNDVRCDGGCWIVYQEVNNPNRIPFAACISCLADSQLQLVRTVRQFGS